MPTLLGNLTDEERRNGWDEASLREIQAEADRMLSRFFPELRDKNGRLRQPIRHEHALSRNPHNWGR